MEALMKIMTPALAIAIVLALTCAGDAARKSKAKAKAKVRAAPTGQIHYPQYSVRGSRTRAGTPCVVYTWEGCLGWDPDPNVRMMIDMDRNRNDR
jgi:hypothetical protein